MEAVEEGMCLGRKGGREVWEVVVIGIGWGVSRIGGGLKECRFGFCVFVIGGW